MSGNPFRRQAQQSQPSAASLEVNSDAWNVPLADSTPPIDTERRRSSTVKRVRIATPPPLSPDSPYEENPIIRRVSTESHEGSPPPSPPPDAQYDSSDSDADSPDGPFIPTDELYAREELINNTRRNSETNTVSLNATGGVVNPFQRTLATMEPRDSSAVDQDIPDPQTAEPKSNKGQMDVDAFKRMLLTGDPQPSESANSSAPTSAAPSSTSNVRADGSIASSLSQYSLSEASQTPTNSEKKPKPPPPKHRHGKSVEQPRAPRTVSFDDFAPTDPLGATPKSQSKALPQIPQRKDPSEELISSPQPTTLSNTPSESPQRQNEASVSAQPEAAPPSQTPQRNPPPPPLTRRSSQAQAKREPPPPQTSIPSSYVPGPQTSASPAPPFETTADSKPAKPPPPPPTRRQAPKQAPSPDPPIQESVSSALVDEPTTVLASPLSSNAGSNRASMPPPPPPRRRGSSKSSAEFSAKAVLGSLSPSGSRRASQDSVSKTNELPVGKAATSQDSSAETNSSGIDDINVLENMDRLQAEVDALRAKYGKSG